MRYRATLAVAIGSFGLLWAGEAGAETLTRQEAIARALRQNPQIAAARARVKQAEAMKGQADAARWPRISVAAGTGPSLQADLVDGTAVGSRESAYDVEIDDLTITVGAQAGVLQPLYTFGKISHRRDAAEHAIDARQAQTDMTRAEVALEVARLYEGYLFARDATRFFEEVQRMLEPSIQETEQRLEAGKPDVSEKDLLQLQSAMSIAKTQLHRAQAAMQQAEGGIRAYLGMSENETFEPAEPSLEVIPAQPPTYERLVGTAKAQRPELLALREGAAAFNQLAEAEEAGYFPDFFALATATAAYTPGRDLVTSRYVYDPLYHFVPNLIVGVRWTLQGDMPGEKAAEQRAAAMDLQNQRRWAFQGIPAEVRKAYEDVQRASKDIDVASEGVQRAKKWIVRATADYTIGLTESEQVADALEAYALLRVQAIESRYRYNVAMAELAKATGTLAAGGDRLYPGEASEHQPPADARATQGAVGRDKPQSSPKPSALHAPEGGNDDDS